MEVDRRRGRFRRWAARAVLPVLLLGGVTASGVPAHGEDRALPYAVTGGPGWVPLSAVPLSVRYAIRAAWDDAEPRGGRLRTLLGGVPEPSGLTVAYARTLDPGRDPADLARRLEQRLDRDTILERYVNTGYYGRGAWGIGAAADAWFGVPPDRLGAAEGAVLAAALTDPEADPATAERRWAEIVAAAGEREWLTVGLRYPPVRAPRGRA